MINKPFLFLILSSTIFLLSCQGTSPIQETTTQSPIPDSLSFKGEIKGEEASLYVLENTSGMAVALTNFGARIVSVIVNDKEGNATDVVLGFSHVQDYYNQEEPYFGPVVGPFGNRIAKGKMILDGETYNLPINNGPNTLHGGLEGLHFQVWQTTHYDNNSVTFSCALPDAAEGYPGNRQFKVTYSLNEDNELSIAYEAISDKKTVFNLTNHAYFNLNGEGSGTILDHQLRIFADHYTPVDESLIPTGELQAVIGTPFDFTTAKQIGKDIETEDTQLSYGKGYDHNFVLNGTKEGIYTYACQLVGDRTGIIMDVYTQEPGLQFYSGNFMSDKVTLKNGSSDSFRTGLCLETQHFPDAPNQPNFPNTIYEEGEVYKTTSIYKFSIN